MHLYAAGSNGSGQLSIGHLDDVSSFTPTQFHPSIKHLLPNSTIIDLVSTSTHALLLLSTEGGNILLCAGTNTLGQLGPKCLLWEGSRAETRWKPVDLLCGLGRGGHEDWEAVKIAATWTTSFVVYRRRTGEGAAGWREEVDEILVSCGSNDFGELGRNSGFVEKGAASDLPTMVDLGMEPGERVEIIRGGQRHVLALISGPKGQRVIGWGASRKGELDTSVLNSTLSAGIPTEDPSLGLTEDGRSKGKGKAKSLDKSNIRQSILPPTTLHLPIPSDAHIVDIRLGASHSLVLLSTGRILAWGSDAKGQIKGLSSVSDVSAIGAMWGGSYLIRQLPDGSPALHSQGANTYDQLLRSDSGGGVDLPKDRQAVGIVAGSEHLLVHLRDGNGDNELWVGGWNEHGNLGLGDKVDRGKLVQVDMSSFAQDSDKGVDMRIKGIWGGCGSSFIWIE